MYIYNNGLYNKSNYMTPPLSELCLAGVVFIFLDLLGRTLFYTVFVTLSYADALTNAQR